MKLDINLLKFNKIKLYYIYNNYQIKIIKANNFISNIIIN
jgi:hypothetical protein